jgi:hypothetical protein
MGPHARSRVADPSASPPRLSPVAVAVVLAALFLGVAAALLSGAPPTPSTLPSSSGAYVSYNDIVIFGWVIVGLTVAWIGYRIVQRIRNPKSSQIHPFVVVAIVCLLLLVGFVAVVHVFGPKAVPSGGPESTEGRNNTTGAAPTPPPSPLGLPGNLTVGSHTIPGWAAYLLVIGVTVVVAFLAVPLAYALTRRKPGAPAAEAANPAELARAEIAATLAALEADPGADPRALIVALYGRLLATVDARAGDTGTRTAREVEATAVARWRLPPAAAHELTGLFEEARYSRHPIGRADTDRARRALQDVLDAIDRSAAR